MIRRITLNNYCFALVDETENTSYYSIYCTMSKDGYETASVVRAVRTGDSYYVEAQVIREQVVKTRNARSEKNIRIFHEYSSMEARKRYNLIQRFINRLSMDTG